MDTIRDIYHIFLECPDILAGLVFEDGIFLGLLFKKDVESMLIEDEDFILDKLVALKSEDIEEFLFVTQPRVKTKIPYIDIEKKNIEHIFYEEFVSEFFPEEFSTRLSLNCVFRNFEHPILILNRFRRVLYLNTASEETFSKKILGEKISTVLLGMSISFENSRMIITRQHEKWELLISESQDECSLYYIYQFIKIPQ